MKKKDNTTAKCERCGRIMRPLRTKAADWPGAVTRSSTTCCQACKNAETRGTGPIKLGRFKAGTKCKVCRHKMRPNGTTQKLYPGMRIHMKDNICRGCYRKVEQANRATLNVKGTRILTPRKPHNTTAIFDIGDRPTGLTRLELLSRIGLEQYIEDRRTRGVPTEGIPLEKWIRQNQVIDNERLDLN